MGKHDSGRTSNPTDGYQPKHGPDAKGTPAQNKALEERLRQQGKIK